MKRVLLDTALQRRLLLLQGLGFRGKFLDQRDLPGFLSRRPARFADIQCQLDFACVRQFANDLQSTNT
jgi:hypothetical protein